MRWIRVEKRAIHRVDRYGIHRLFEQRTVLLFAAPQVVLGTDPFSHVTRHGLDGHDAARLIPVGNRGADAVHDGAVSSQQPCAAIYHCPITFQRAHVLITFSRVQIVLPHINAAHILSGVTEEGEIRGIRLKQRAVSCHQADRIEGTLEERAIPQFAQLQFPLDFPVRGDIPSDTHQTLYISVSIPYRRQRRLVVVRTIRRRSGPVIDHELSLQRTRVRLAVHLCRLRTEDIVGRSSQEELRCQPSPLDPGAIHPRMTLLPIQREDNVLHRGHDAAEAFLALTKKALGFLPLSDIAYDSLKSNDPPLLVSAGNHRALDIEGGAIPALVAHFVGDNAMFGHRLQEAHTIGRVCIQVDCGHVPKFITRIAEEIEPRLVDVNGHAVRCAYIDGIHRLLEEGPILRLALAESHFSLLAFGHIVIDALEGDNAPGGVLQCHHRPPTIELRSVLSPEAHLIRDKPGHRDLLQEPLAVGSIHIEGRCPYTRNVLPGITEEIEPRLVRLQAASIGSADRDGIEGLLEQGTILGLALTEGRLSLPAATDITRDGQHAGSATGFYEARLYFHRQRSAVTGQIRRFEDGSLPREQFTNTPPELGGLSGREKLARVHGQQLIASIAEHPGSGLVREYESAPGIVQQHRIMCRIQQFAAQPQFRLIGVPTCHVPRHTEKEGAPAADNRARADLHIDAPAVHGDPHCFEIESAFSNHPADARRHLLRPFGSVEAPNVHGGQFRWRIPCEQGCRLIGVDDLAARVDQQDGIVGQIEEPALEFYLLLRAKAFGDIPHDGLIAHVPARPIAAPPNGDAAVHHRAILLL